MFEGSTDLARADEFDEAEPMEDAHVVGDVAQRRVERVESWFGLASPPALNRSRIRCRSGCESALASFGSSGRSCPASLPERDIDQLKLPKQRAAPAQAGHACAAHALARSVPTVVFAQRGTLVGCSRRRAPLGFSAVDAVRVSGLRIVYERAGAGPPLVLVHGAGDDGRVWQPQLAALADEFTVVVGMSQAPGARTICLRA